MASSKTVSMHGLFDVYYFWEYTHTHTHTHNLLVEHRLCFS